MSELWWGIVLFAGGAASGALLTYMLRHRFGDSRALRRKLDELTREAEAFRVEVDQHFAKTSDLFEEVTEKYRDLYDHLAEGATGLSRNAQTRLSFDPPDAMLPAAVAAPGDESHHPVEIEQALDESPQESGAPASEAADADDATAAGTDQEESDQSERGVEIVRPPLDHALPRDVRAGHEPVAADVELEAADEDEDEDEEPKRSHG